MENPLPESTDDRVLTAGESSLWQQLRHRLPSSPMMLGMLAGTLLLGAVGISFGAIWLLVRVVELPDCRSTLWFETNPSTRLYCAEEVASETSIKNLRDAIEIANSVAVDDPLRSKSDRLIEQWSRDLLRIGENAFQEGDLDTAIEAARSVPSNSAMADQAEKQAEEWKTLWDKAEAIYNDVQKKIENQEWSAAVSTARDLMGLNNTYWATTKHQELMEALRSAKEADKKSPNADKLAKGRETKSGTRDPLADWRQKQQAESDARLGKAYRLAGSGSLKAAIEEAEWVYYGTPRYEEAQKAIDNWKKQLETMEDRPYLSRAVELANKGDAASLQAAIDEANQIYPGRPLYGEARNRVEQWTQKMNQLQLDAQSQKPPKNDSIDPGLTPVIPAPSPISSPQPANDRAPVPDIPPRREPNAPL